MRALHRGEVRNTFTALDWAREGGGEIGREGASEGLLSSVFFRQRLVVLFVGREGEYGRNEWTYTRRIYAGGKGISRHT